ncbi:hypothetical protein DL96DRAFT_1612170 [Flagelloscypha sp. PMI_526]|nr:hypothetical protein DL96DRAFT_1612170 [Flagelloscypha sp. PMI_526]
MTPEEQQLLNFYGKSIVGNFALFTTLTLFYGCYLLIAPYAVYILIRRGDKSLATLGLLVSTITIFLTATAHWATYLQDILTTYRLPLIEIQGHELLDQFLEVTRRNMPILRFHCIPPVVTFLFCDALVVSRVWAIFPERRRERYITLIVFIVDISLNLHWAIAIQLRPLDIYDPRRTPLFGWKIAAYGFSLITNLVGTGFIAYKAWCFRRHLLQSGIKSKSSSVLRILAFLVESGGFFMVLQLLAILFNPDLFWKRLTTVDIFGRSILEMVTMLTAIYPSLVIIILDAEKKKSSNRELVFGDDALSASRFPSIVTQIAFAEARSRLSYSSASSVLSPTTPWDVKDCPDSSHLHDVDLTLRRPSAVFILPPPVTQ